MRVKCNARVLTRAKCFMCAMRFTHATHLTTMCVMCAMHFTHATCFMCALRKKRFTWAMHFTCATGFMRAKQIERARRSPQYPGPGSPST